MGDKGITLIALIITIIVILILATVSINGIREGGIFRTTIEAVELARGTRVREELEIWVEEVRRVNVLGGSHRELKDVLEELVSRDLITEEEKEELLSGGTIEIGDQEISFDLENIRSWNR